MSLVDLIQNHCDVAELKKAITAGADVNEISDYGNSILMVAVLNNRVDLLESLLQAGANSNYANEDNSESIATALFESELFIDDEMLCKNGIPALEILFRYGLDINWISSKGDCLLHSAISVSSVVVKWLLDHDVQFYKWDGDFGGTPLLDACWKGSLETVKLIMDRSDFFECDKAGNTALHCAIATGKPSLIEFLIDRGADLNAVNQEGWTPLMTAARRIRLKPVKILLERGADFTLKNNQGLSALDLAEEAKQILPIKGQEQDKEKIIAVLKQAMLDSMIKQNQDNNLNTL